MRAILSSPEPRSSLSRLRARRSFTQELFMPSGPFAHVCFLVKDLDKATEDWTKILGVLDPAQLAEPVVKYEEFSSGADQGMRWVTFVAHHGCEIQLIQPTPGTPLGERLEKLG